MKWKPEKIVVRLVQGLLVLAFAAMIAGCAGLGLWLFAASFVLACLPLVLFVGVVIYERMRRG